MKICEGASPRYLRVLPDATLNKKLLLGWRQRKNDEWLTVENNLVNRVVLGLPLLVSRNGEVSVQHPEGLKDYQIKDVEKCLMLKHFLNANPMGLGKTPETVRYLLERKAQTCLIVCPKIIRYQWQNQLAVWGDFQSRVYEESTRVVPGIWIINYDRLRNESTRNRFRAFQWEYLVLDEAHRIKNRSSQQTRAVKEIPAATRIALTGTPILRYVDDLWSILNFLDESYASISYWSFREYFCDIKQTPWGPRVAGLTKDADRVAILNYILGCISIRNEVEVAHGKTVEVVRLPMDKKQRELYSREKNLVLDELPKGLTIPNGAVLTLRLMQTTSWPGLYLEGLAGPKFEWIEELCNNNPEESIVVFSVFERTVRALVTYLADRGIPSVSITGKQTSKECEANKQLFTSRRARVLAGTIGAMGQGYDGLQKVSRTMVFVDRDWSPEIMAQAEDRLRRIGQDNPVTIYYLECTGSFDQHVGRVNRTKADDIRRALQS